MTGRTGVTLVVALLALVVAGCGSGPKDPQKAQSTQPRSFPMRATGTDTASKITVPNEVPGGLTRLDFRNDAQGPHAVQIIRIDGGHEPDEALAAGNAWAQKGRPLPDWVEPAGGTPVTESGAKSSVIQVLSPGDYIVFDTELEGPSKVAAEFRVTAPAGGEVRGAPSRIEEFEYGFKATGLTAGSNRVFIDNKGKEPHFVEAAPLKPGKTAADVKRFVKDEKGPPPVEFGAGVSTPVIDGGAKQLVDLNFKKKGKWALLCFVPDRKGGPPHALKGMVAVAEVQ